MIEIDHVENAYNKWVEAEQEFYKLREQYEFQQYSGYIGSKFVILDNKITKGYVEHDLQTTFIPSGDEDSIRKILFYFYPDDCKGEPIVPILRKDIFDTKEDAVEALKAIYSAQIEQIKARMEKLN